MKNLNLQLFSLLVALLLALFVNSESNSSVLGFVVPVEIKNLPAGKTILLQSNTQVQVTIKGPSFLISRVVSSLPIFRISIPPEVKNRYVATLNSNDLALPAYVQVLSIEPSEIEFTFDNIVTTELPVVVPRIGSLPDNLRMEEIVINPSQVTVTGPETEIKDLRGIETYPIDLRDVQGNVDRTLNLRSPSRLSKVSQPQVTVTVKVVSVQDEKSFTELPIEIRSVFGGRKAVVPATVSVSVSGSKDTLSTLTQDMITPYVRMPAEAAAGQDLDVAIDVPRGVTVTALAPAKVRVAE